jgi:sialate O-acetylesterase
MILRMQTTVHSSPLAMLMLCVSAAAQIQPASVFSDHMVLQRNRPIAIWGTAAPHEAVTVTLADESVQTAANAAGHWSVRLASHQAGGPFELRMQGSNEVTFQDVLIGEVWICSGQSNMNWTMQAHEDSKAALPLATDGMLRILKIPQLASEEPQFQAKASWSHATAETLPSFTAVGYGFGRHLRETLQVPVGLVQSAWGGTRAEAWMRETALAEHAELTPILERWQSTFAQLPEATARYEKALAKWQTQAAEAKAAGKQAPRRPQAPAGRNSQHAPGRLYNGMIQPLVPMSIAGVIWYQGESNAARAYQYRTLFPAMITDWREAFGQGQFPFLFVQLAAFEDKAGDPQAWAELREAQTMTLSLPNTGMACIIDLGTKNNIHPPHKLEVGRRLGLLARSLYGEKIVASGPLFSHFTIEGAQIRVHFDHIGAGLMAKAQDDGSNALLGFEIAAADGAFEPALAKLDGNTVVVSNASMPAPRHVRYAFRHWPTCNLFNQDGLPASPFRTDTRKGVTADAR